MDDIDSVNLMLEAATERASRAIRQRIALQEALPVVTERDCIECGDAISPARLKAISHAELCVDCQSIMERRA